MQTVVTSDQTDIGEAAWYCLRAQLKREHIAAAQIRTLDGVTVLCPRLRFKRSTRQGLVWVTEAMFPGYLFAHFDFLEKHRQVQNAHCVRGIVHFGYQYPTIEERALAFLRGQTGVGEVKELTYGLSQGDEVKFIGGVFAGLEAVVTQVHSSRERVKILFDFLGRQIEAEVERSSVLACVARPLVA